MGVVFLASGASKVFDRRWPAAAASFGLPAVGARVLPVVELVLGAGLVVGLGGRWTVVVALGLLAAFTGAVAGQLARGRRPVCACFGAWSARPVGAATLVRNVAVAAIGVLALW